MYYRWTEEKVNLLRVYYPTSSWEDLFKILGYNNKPAIKNAVKRYNVSRDKSLCRNVKKYNPEVLLQKLQEVSVQLGRAPMLREFKAYNLPSEVNYRRYFGSLNNAFALINIERPDYEQMITGNHVMYDNHGGVCYSITEQMISNFLIAQNVTFEKEILYSSVIDSPLCKTKRFDWKINNKFIEYFGLIGYHGYEDGMEEKINLCKQHNIALLSLLPKDIQSGEWKNKILSFIK